MPSSHLIVLLRSDGPDFWQSRKHTTLSTFDLGHPLIEHATPDELAAPEAQVWQVGDTRHFAVQDLREMGLGAAQLSCPIGDSQNLRRFKHLDPFRLRGCALFLAPSPVQFMVVLVFPRASEKLAAFTAVRSSTALRLRDVRENS